MLGNFYWLQGKLIATDINGLISDFDYLPQSPLPNLQSKIQSLKSKIHHALLLSSHTLRNDPHQLPSQLSGRLRSFSEPVIQSLLQQIDTTDFLGFNCLSPSLTPLGGALIRTLIGHSSSVNAVTITPDGKLVISNSDDNTLKIWNLVTGEELFTLTGHSEWISTVAVIPDCKQVIFGLHDDILKVWDLVTGEIIATFMGDSSIKCCAVAPDGVTVVAGEESGQVHFLKLRTP